MALRAAAHIVIANDSLRGGFLNQTSACERVEDEALDVESLRPIGGRHGAGERQGESETSAHSRPAAASARGCFSWRNAAPGNSMSAKKPDTGSC